MQRVVLGFLAVCSFVIGVVLSVSPWFVAASPLGGPFLRAALVLGVIWLGWPQLSRLPIWAAPLILVAIVLAVRYPKIIPLMVLIGIALVVVRPRNKAAVRPRGKR